MIRPYFEDGDFVHVVGTVDIDTGNGTIRYVNPSRKRFVGNAETEPRVALIALDGDGSEIHRQEVVLRRGSGAPGRSSNAGLIQEDVPRQLGMAAVALMVDGREVARYDAGAPAPLAPARALSMTAGSSPHKLNLSLAGVMGNAPAPGVTYTVQVRPDNADAWSTIAVGQATPRLVLDRNQFPGATRAVVRVLRTNGFEEAVVAEEEIDLETGASLGAAAIAPAVDSSLAIDLDPA